MACRITDHEAEDGTEHTLIENGDTEPVQPHIADIGPVVQDIEGEVDEGEGHAIVAAGLGRQEVTQMLRDSLGELALTNDGRRQDGISSRDAGGAYKTLEPVERWHHPPDEQTGDQPAPGHDGDQEQGHGSPMALHISLGQLDTDGETLYDQDDARALEGDFVDIAPFVGIE